MRTGRRARAASSKVTFASIFLQDEAAAGNPDRTPIAGYRHPTTPMS